jgi:mycofactocin precursor
MSQPDPTQTDPNEDQILAEDLIEEVSIDGMCGVY